MTGPYVQPLALFALSTADTATTLFGLTQGAREAAPLASAALAAVGPLAIVALGIVGPLAELAILSRLPKPFRRPGWALALVMAAYPVANNAAVLLA